jgi:hypothetical protein
MAMACPSLSADELGAHYAGLTGLGQGKPHSARRERGRYPNPTTARPNLLHLKSARLCGTHY